MCIVIITCDLKEILFNYILLNWQLFLLLQLLYVDSAKFEVIQTERKRPVICHWTKEKLKMRETYEKEELGNFGTGEFSEEFIAEELNEDVNLIRKIIQKTSRCLIILIFNHIC